MAPHPLKFEQLEDHIIKLREQPVLLDADVAELYDVETRDINKAVANNPDKFPEGYVAQLSKREKTELVENFGSGILLNDKVVATKNMTGCIRR